MTVSVEAACAAQGHEDGVTYSTWMEAIGSVDRGFTGLRCMLVAQRIGRRM